MSDIQALTSKVQQLGSSASLWNRLALWAVAATAIVAAMYFVFSLVASRKNTALQTAQAELDHAKDSQLAGDLKDKEVAISAADQKAASAKQETARLTKEAEQAKSERTEADKQIAIAKADAARAKEGMANADARSLEAQRRAAEASTKAESFRLDIAKANERAAEANRIAEEEKLARVRIEQRLADRAITKADAARIAERIGPYKGRVFQVVTFWDDREPLATAQRLADVLVAAGWKLDQPKEWQGLLGGLSGIQVFFHPEASAEAKRAAEALVSALNAVGLSAIVKQQNDPGHPTEKIHINVGTKP